jgi:hypothetical protein
LAALTHIVATGTQDILFRNNSTDDTWFEALSNGNFTGWHQVGGSDTSYTSRRDRRMG